MAQNHHQHQLHFILFPLMAQGHMIPTVDMARLFAQRGVVVTIVTTPRNSSRFKTIVDRATKINLPLRLLQLKFPSVEVGLPEGCENLDTLPTGNLDLVKNFFTATAMLQQPLEQSLAEMEPAPSCIISDYCLPWTSDTARKFDIPRLIFHGESSFFLLCSHNMLHYKSQEKVISRSEPFVIPGLPDCIEITMSRVPRPANTSLATNMNEFFDQMNDAELTAYGVVVNSFYDLEPGYIREYQKAKYGKAWPVGPVSLCNKEMLDIVERGNKASIDDSKCMEWLDSRQPKSVIYFCLGSLCRLSPAQLKEIGLGLESSKCSFIWVINAGIINKELGIWLSEEGFEERIKDRGLIIKGWAPQVLILSHQVIGGFVTHCGWNSTLEAVCAGVPMITWPMFADQFLNEKLIVQVLGLGVEVGVGEPVQWGAEGYAVVTKEDVEKAIKRLLSDDDEGKERREKASKHAVMARKAMEEGGSSHESMTVLIEDIRQEACKKAFIHKQNASFQEVKENHTKVLADS